VADEKKYPVPHQAPQLPSRTAPSVPALPASAGGFALTRTSRANKDATFSRAYADQLRALADSYKAGREYSDARFDFAVALNKWHTLDEVCEHEYRKGFLSRASELKVLAVELETKEITARISRDAAMLALQAYQPQPAQPVAAATPAGLTPDEVIELLSPMGDIPEETKKNIAYMLLGLVKEKSK